MNGMRVLFALAAVLLACACEGGRICRQSDRRAGWRHRAGAARRPSGESASGRNRCAGKSAALRHCVKEVAGRDGDGQQVRCGSRAVDDYGRLIATVYADELNVNHEQVRRGMAWEYSRFHSNRDLTGIAARSATGKTRAVGWRVDIEPSQWRKQHSGDAAAPCIVPIVTHGCCND